MKKLNSKQVAYVHNVIGVVLASAHLTSIGGEVAITSGQWAQCDKVLVADIIKHYREKKGIVVLTTNESQRTRAGWPTVKFVADDKKVADACASYLSRGRQKIEASNGYVQQLTKEDELARLVKAQKRINRKLAEMTAKKREQFRALVKA